MPNWLDIVLGLILAFSILGGFAKGIARTGIGFAAVIVGILCGMWFYGSVGAMTTGFIGSRPVANLIGFVAIFVFVLIVGGLIGGLIEKVLKFAHLSWLNRLLGAAFGVVRGMLICAVVVFVLMAFSVKPPPQSVAHSRLAPYAMTGARALAYAAPHDVRAGFHRSYEKVKQIWAEMFEKKPRKVPAEQL